MAFSWVRKGRGLHDPNDKRKIDESEEGGEVQVGIMWVGEMKERG